MKKEAQNILLERSPRRYAAMTNAIPEAIFLPCPKPLIQDKRFHCVGSTLTAVA